MSSDVVLRVSVKSFSPECKGEVVRRVCDIGNLGYRTLTRQGVDMRRGDLCDDIKLCGIRLRAIEFTNKHVALMACFRADVVEERIANQSPKSRKGRPTHTFGTTVP